MTTTMILTTEQFPAGPVLAVAGDLDYESAGRFRAAVDAVALQPGQLLTVDLSGLAFCDSSGITALIAARHHTYAHGADITLTHVPATTVRVMRLLGLDQIFRIHPTPEPNPDPA